MERGRPAAPVVAARTGRDRRRAAAAARPRLGRPGSPARPTVMSVIVMTRHGGGGGPASAARAATGRRRGHHSAPPRGSGTPPRPPYTTARQRAGAAAAVKCGGGGPSERVRGWLCGRNRQPVQGAGDAMLAVRCSRSRQTGRGAGGSALNGTGRHHRDQFTGADVVTVPVADHAPRRGAPLGRHSHDAQVDGARSYSRPAMAAAGSVTAAAARRTPRTHSIYKKRTGHPMTKKNSIAVAETGSAQTPITRAGKRAPRVIRSTDKQTRKRETLTKPLLHTLLGEEGKNSCPPAAAPTTPPGTPSKVRPCSSRAKKKELSNSSDINKKATRSGKADTAPQVERTRAASVHTSAGAEQSLSHLQRPPSDLSHRRATAAPHHPPPNKNPTPPTQSNAE